MPNYPNHLQIETIAGCNATCTMCPVPEMKRRKGVMGLGLYQTIVEQAGDAGITQIVPYLNGEPFLDPYLFERLDILVEKGVTFHLFTNASKLTQKRANRLAGYPLRELVISFVGGTRAAYERVMGLDWDKVKANVDYMIRIAPFPVKVYMTEFEDNTGTVPQFIERWGERAFVGAYSNWAGKKDLAVAEPRLQAPKPCPRVMERMTVLWDGRVSLCCLDVEGEVILGDLKTQTIQEVWEKNYWRRQAYENLNFDMELCRLCNWNRFGV